MNTSPLRRSDDLLDELRTYLRGPVSGPTVPSDREMWHPAQAPSPALSRSTAPAPVAAITRPLFA